MSRTASRRYSSFEMAQYVFLIRWKTSEMSARPFSPGTSRCFCEGGRGREREEEGEGGRGKKREGEGRRGRGREREGEGGRGRGREREGEGQGEGGTLAGSSGQ